MPDKNSTKGKLVEPETNEKKLKKPQKDKPDLRNEKIPNRTSIYEKLDNMK